MGGRIMKKLGGVVHEIIKNLRKNIMQNKEQGNTNWIILFDGGSRGNPGYGGSDTITLTEEITEFQIQALITDNHEKKLATHNQAECKGLLNGNQYINNTKNKRSKQHSVLITGDSK